MTGVSRYLTVAGSTGAEIEVTRSRFLCTLERVPDEAAARAVVERLRGAHRDARHHCSAFVLGPPPQPVERASDDGEPAGTAGAPMLEVLRGAHAGQGLSDVVAVVTRWFGGTLLGAGGLVRAYGDAVRAAVEAAPVVERQLLHELRLVLPHAEAGRVETALRGRGIAVLGTDWGAEVTLRLGVAPPEAADVDRWAAELTSGAARTEKLGERWVDRA
ncbi:YigZ family protein [Nocardioides nanhaiensis]|uniref:YigZ family protein n=1 Tax=Nocardioides nanhaiensis TaxID=1476871 RepID=A0ABP8W0A7_9ACTN